MAPGANGAATSSRSALPDGSYAKAAKSLQTSGLSVSARIDVAEALLCQADRLTPRPEPLVRQHAIFALCSSRVEFEEYRPRYWKLLCALHKRDPVPLPETLAAAATVSFRSEGSSPAELSACVDTLDTLFSGGSLLPQMEVLAALIAGACECRLEGRCAVADVEGLDARMERLLVAMLIQYDDMQRRNQIAKRTFANAFKFLMYPVLRSDGVVRKAGEIVLRYGLFPRIEDVLNTGTYYDVLYDMLEKGNASPHSEVVLELVEFLFRSCKELAHDRADRAPAFPKVGEKRAIADIDESLDDHNGFAIADVANGSLPRQVSIPLRFLKDMFKGLLTNVEKREKESGGVALPVLSRLLATAADLRAYRPSYEASVARPFKKVKTKNKDGKLVRTDPPTEENIGTMMSKLIAFVSEQLQALSLQDMAGARSSTDEEERFAQVASLAQCGTAIIRLSMESIQNDLPALLQAVLSCALKVNEFNGPCDSLALLLGEMFHVHSSTRKVPELFLLLASSLNEEVVLDNLHVLLADSTLQESIVESIWTLPRGHAEECIQALIGPGCFRPKAAASVCFLLSLIVESVDLPTLKTILPILGKGLGAKVASATDMDFSLRSGLAFVHASVASTLAKKSFGQSSALYMTFAVYSKFSKFFSKLKKTNAEIVKAKDPQHVGYQVCELRLLAALTHLSAADCSGDHDKSASRKAMVRALRKVRGLPAGSTIGNKSDSSELSSCSKQWEALLLGQEKNWTTTILRIVGSLGPLMDFFVLKDGQVEDPDVVDGIKQILLHAMTNASGTEAFWDGMLETEVAHLFVCKCAVSVLDSNADDGTKLFVFSLIPMMTSRFMYADQLMLTCEKVASDTANSQVLRTAAERGATFLQAQTDQCSQDKRRKMLTARKFRGEEACAHVDDAVVAKNIIFENSQTIVSASQRVLLRTTKTPEGLEVSVCGGVERILASVGKISDTGNILRQFGDTSARLAVCLCHWAWHGSIENDGAYLQLISVLARDEGNCAIEGIGDLIVKKMQQLIHDVRADAETLNVPWLRRLIRVATALVHGVCGGESSFTWASPPGGILRSVERSTRSAAPRSSRSELVSKIGVVSLQAVAAALWQTRHAKRPWKSGHASGYSVRTTAFIDEQNRMARTDQLWIEAEWAVATIALEGGRTKSLFDSELIQTALMELLDIASGCAQSALLSVVQTGIVRASCMQARRATQGMSCLRCLRAALRSPHLDAACARVISRQFEKVSGTMAVSAIADTATALTRVQDAAVRGALEHGGAALLKDMSEQGRSAALLACSDNARDVLRALIETYRMDFQYNRQ